jgi:hypothetical protein
MYPTMGINNSLQSKTHRRRISINRRIALVKIEKTTVDALNKHLIYRRWTQKATRRRFRLEENQKL